MEGILHIILAHSGSPQTFIGDNTNIGEIMIEIAMVITQKKAPL